MMDDEEIIRRGRSETRPIRDALGLDLGGDLIRTRHFFPALPCPALLCSAL